MIFSISLEKRKQMKEAFLKSWKTTLIGIILIIYLVYKLFFKGYDLDIQILFEMLVALGFMSSKDVTHTHSKFLLYFIKLLIYLESSSYKKSLLLSQIHVRNFLEKQ